MARPGKQRLGGSVSGAVHARAQPAFAAAQRLARRMQNYFE
jgi:hypothetical protein